MTLKFTIILESGDFKDFMQSAKPLFTSEKNILSVSHLDILKMVLKTVDRQPGDEISREQFQKIDRSFSK